jgi:iron complex transport system substrate-binding protein
LRCIDCADVALELLMMRSPEMAGSIASLLSSATEMLFALGAGPRVVAVSHECDFPAEVGNLPRATRTSIAIEADSRAIDDQVRRLLADGQPLYEVDTELLARLRPELIVTQAQCDVCAVRYDDVLTAVAQTPQLSATRVVALNPQSVGDVLADIERLGLAAGLQAEARMCVERLQQRIDRVRQMTARLSHDQRPTVGCIEWIDPLMVAGNWMPELIEWAGGRQSLTEPGAASTYTAWEAFCRFDPEAIVVMPCGFGLERAVRESAALARFPGWYALRAVASGRVYAVDGNQLFNRAGPRLVDSLELLAGLLHPQRFGGLLPPEGSLWQRLA